MHERNLNDFDMVIPSSPRVTELVVKVFCDISMAGKLTRVVFVAARASQ